jgi:hypothetical protein
VSGENSFDREISVFFVFFRFFFFLFFLNLDPLHRNHLLTTEQTSSSGDIQQLDALLKALAFSQAKADSTVRYALLTAVTLLRRHSSAHAQLAEAMLRGEGVVECVAAVEEALASVADDDI